MPNADFDKFEVAHRGELPFHQLLYARRAPRRWAVLDGVIRLAPYATFGSQALAANVATAIEGRSGCC